MGNFSMGSGLMSKPYRVNMAGMDTANQYDMAIGGQMRGLQEMGVNPMATQYSGLMKSTAIDEAANKAANMTQAGIMTDRENFDRSLQTAGLNQQKQRDQMGWDMQRQNLGLQYAQMNQQNNQWGLEHPVRTQTHINLPKQYTRGGLGGF